MNDPYSYSKEELLALVGRMQETANQVYGIMFVNNMGGEVHAFIEFCGVLNKYIDLCRIAAEQGIDFTAANVHSGIALPIEAHHMIYLAEKLECIFAPFLRGNPQVAECLKRALFGEPAGPVP